MRYYLATKSNKLFLLAGTLGPSQGYYAERKKKNLKEFTYYTISPFTQCSQNDKVIVVE